MSGGVYDNEWDRVLHSAGENVPATKLMALCDYPMNTLKALVREFICAEGDGSGRSRVLYGVRPEPGGQANQVLVGDGIGFIYGYTAQFGEFLSPCPVRDVDPFILDDGGADDRYDRIVLRAAMATPQDSVSRTQRQADGSKVVTSLPQREDVHGALSVKKGEEGEGPKPLETGELGIAVIKVPAGWHGVFVLNTHLFDTRCGPVPSQGGSYRFLWAGTGNGGSDPTPAKAYANSLSITPVGPVIRTGSAVYSLTFYTPNGMFADVLVSGGMLGDLSHARMVNGWAAKTARPEWGLDEWACTLVSTSDDALADVPSGVSFRFVAEFILA